MNNYKSSLALRARLCWGGEKTVLVTVAHIPGPFSLPPHSMACETKSLPCQDETFKYLKQEYILRFSHW